MQRLLARGRDKLGAREGSTKPVPQMRSDEARNACDKDAAHRLLSLAVR